MIREVRQDPSISSKELSTIMEKSFNVVASPRTIRHTLQNNDLRCLKRAKKAILTPKMKRKRLDWCRRHSMHGDGFWDRVIWSDESYISLFSGQDTHARRPLNYAFDSRFVRQAPKYLVKVMIWACFASKKLGRIIVLEDTINSAR